MQNLSEKQLVQREMKNHLLLHVQCCFPLLQEPPYHHSSILVRLLQGYRLICLQLVPDRLHPGAPIVLGAKRIVCPFSLSYLHISCSDSSRDVCAFDH